MAYLLVTLNHFKVVQSWARSAGARVNLDVATFELEVRAGNRIYTLYPQFFAVFEGTFGHSPVLSAAADGFIGWLPYKPLRWEMATEKLSFKRFLGTHDEPTPANWVGPDDTPTADFLLKRSRGSFGYDLFGPYHAGTDLRATLAAANGSRPAESTLFAERFVPGTNLKVWFWGGEAFYAHLHPYPFIEGDGGSTVRALVDRRLALVRRRFDESADMMIMRAALDYQRVGLDDVLPAGQKVWLDYRYGRRYAVDPTTAQEDNALARLTVSAREQVARIGQKLGDAMLNELGAPVLFSVDGVVDDEGKVWWLEMNSNPVMPPQGYPWVFRDLFGIPVPAEFLPSSSALAPAATVVRSTRQTSATIASPELMVVP
ncbi:hypothetical protein [Variovorax arabinosiphilus]|uniref:hypothetical protein n=1 Tax=Variovorax arabinosiphilus TaxID=3053498 RepID=UPI002578DBA5|nr:MULTISPECIES: hypothetical protein [unclassified Variovorax]MDM0122210.1 hypothetical protein [Variovorax sp. J2L1-78]MDM0131261.1 hypothetical protein [Variovorax sp. J2L1-63]MDM0234973.1 hypothetical protein [Variovorax sp. J2R1-6]